jgi:hypothetical protein
MIRALQIGSLPTIVATVGRLLLLGMVASFPGTIRIAAAGPFVATNVPGEMLITVDDYLKELPLEALSQEQRTELLASGSVILSDTASASGDYLAAYHFAAPGIQVRSSLMVVPNRDAATKLLASFVRSFTQSAQKQGISLQPVEGLDTWYPGSRFFVVSRTDEPQLGNYFVVIDDDTVYVVTLVGAGAYVDADNVRQFLGPKLELAMTLLPDIPASLRTPTGKFAAKSPKAEVADSSMAQFFLLFFIFVYWAGRWLAHAINWLCKRALVSPTLSGLLAMLVVAVGLGWAMMLAISQSVAGLREIDPFRAGELQGEIVGRLLAPILIISVVIGVRRMKALKPADKTPAKDVTSGPA